MPLWSTSAAGLFLALTLLAFPSTSQAAGAETRTEESDLVFPVLVAPAQLSRRPLFLSAPNTWVREVHAAITIDQYERPRFERPLPWETFAAGRYGWRSWQEAPRLGVWSRPVSWTRRSATLRLAPISFNFNPLTLGPARKSECDVPIVTVSRLDGERATLRMLDCDGQVTADAVDQLSVLARAVGTRRPDLPLPMAPDPTAADGDWVPGVRMVHPRLAWAISSISARFDGRTIFIVSGYRPDSGTSRHAEGRALDIRIPGVTNQLLFDYCRTLPDVACGYYPNSTFVHVDARPLGRGHAIWVDVSRPGEPSQYVDSWPGVVEAGAMLWSGEIIAG